MESKWTILDVITYKLEYGTEAAYNLLLLAGPDAYAGDYNATLDTLEAKMKEKHIINEGRL